MARTIKNIKKGDKRGKRRNKTVKKIKQVGGVEVGKPQILEKCKIYIKAITTTDTLKHTALIDTRWETQHTVGIVMARQGWKAMKKYCLHVQEIFSPIHAACL
jgi:hypothetical protein